MKNKKQITRNKEQKKRNLLSVICYLLSERRAFTLLELLVVISIIAIMVTIGLSSFSTAQKKGRDAKRKSDVRDIQTAMEQYYSVCGFSYVTPGSSIICSSPSIAIMTKVPSDPRGNSYVCSPCDASSYTLCANNMEAESPTGYCVSNQQ